MAIGAVARGDLVVVHSTRYNLRGLFVVDSVNGDKVRVFTLDDANVLPRGQKGGATVLDKTTEIVAVYTASSISV